VIFAFHAYPWLIHRLTYRRANHRNIHVRGYKEEGTITKPFDMTVLNDMDRFHLVMDAIDRLPQTGDQGVALKRKLELQLIEHERYIREHGQDLPEVRNWRRSTARAMGEASMGAASLGSAIAGGQESCRRSRLDSDPEQEGAVWL
jgi:xylulose-5-phosphate/fructose-6-phosphate phosphoketolase